HRDENAQRQSNRKNNHRGHCLTASTTFVHALAAPVGSIAACYHPPALLNMQNRWSSFCPPVALYLNRRHAPSAGHADSRTTKIYDRRGLKGSLGGHGADSLRTSTEHSRCA